MKSNHQSLKSIRTQFHADLADLRNNCNSIITEYLRTHSDITIQGISEDGISPVEYGIIQVGSFYQIKDSLDGTYNQPDDIGIETLCLIADTLKHL